MKAHIFQAYSSNCPPDTRIGKGVWMKHAKLLKFKEGSCFSVKHNGISFSDILLWKGRLVDISVVITWGQGGIKFLHQCQSPGYKGFFFKKNLAL